MQVPLGYGQLLEAGGEKWHSTKSAIPSSTYFDQSGKSVDLLYMLSAFTGSLLSKDVVGCTSFAFRSICKCEPVLGLDALAMHRRRRVS